ncbi:MAG: hypothetical protein ABI875_09345 [Gemmatimonadales bacterium]
MRLAYEKGVVTLGAIVLAASVFFLVRLAHKAHRRKSMRDRATATLRASGEHFFSAVEREPLSGPIVD